MRKFIVYSFFIAVLFFSCSNPETNEAKVKDTEIILEESVLVDSILSRGKLIAVTDYGITSYFIYRGQPLGYQFEMLNQLCLYLGVQLDLRLEEDLEKSMSMLNSGEVDIIAMGLTVTNQRKQKFDFTDPILTTRQVLVQRKPDGFQKMRTLDEIESHLIRNPMDLAGKTIYIQRGTIYKDQLQNLANSIADSIYIIEDQRITNKLIEAVAKGEIDFTVADEHLALVNRRQYHNIDIKTPISFPQKISWAARKGETQLIDTINYWLQGFKKDLKFRLIYNKYFLNKRVSSIANSTYNSHAGNKLSPYDEIFKKYAPIIGWDWRLIASMSYQESQFKPNARSWVGAYGLMQLMPAVFKEYGIDTTATPDEQIYAGIQHLKYKTRQIPEEISDSLERIKFTLAAYNSGIGHILDARRLTEKYGKNPNVWKNNVEEFVLKLSDKKYYTDPVVYYGYARGVETVDFVNEVMYRFEQYKTMIKE